jgi:hypothetical protein
VVLDEQCPLLALFFAAALLRADGPVTDAD